jgi:outer membrane autotransporter protein
LAAASSQSRAVTDRFDNTNISAGADYRLSDRAVIGAALGFASFDSDLTDAGSSVTKTRSVSVYGSYAVNDQLYVDARLGYGRSSLDLTRKIAFGYRNFNVDRTAFGQTDASQSSFAISAGYTFQAGSSTSITPNIGLRYLRSKLDAFSETGALDNNIRFASQSIRSLQYNLGVQASRAISLSYGVFVPQFDLSFTREGQNDNNRIGAQLIASSARSFNVIDDQPDRSFGSAGLGFVFVFGNGKQAYLNYRRLFANDTVSQQSVNLGGRLDF